MIDFGQPLDGIAGIEQHAGPEHGARDATVCTAGIASPSAQGQVMISTAIAGDDGIVPACARQPTQPSMVSSAVACTTGA